MHASCMNVLYTCVYMCIYIHISIHMQIHTYIYTYTVTCMRACMFVCISTSAPALVSIATSTSISAYLFLMPYPLPCFVLGLPGSGHSCWLQDSSPCGAAPTWQRPRSSSAPRRPKLRPLAVFLERGFSIWLFEKIGGPNMVLWV